MTKPNNHKIFQKTITKPISYIGIGLHTGKQTSMTVLPANENTGINCIRKDIKYSNNLIPAKWYNVVDTTLSTVIANEDGSYVKTIEHLMAALHGCGIDNVMIEIDGPEVPILDGSANPFVTLIERIGTTIQFAKRHAIWIHEPITVQIADKTAVLMPDNSMRITVSIDFPQSLIGSQIISIELVNEAFRRDISPARTFGFKNQIEKLQADGLALGGGLHNAILVDGDRIVNQGGLRYHNEFARHKVLDCLGDLALLGHPVYGHYFTHKPGHELNNALIKEMFEQRDKWSYILIDDFESIQNKSKSENYSKSQQFYSAVKAQ